MFPLSVFCCFGRGFIVKSTRQKMISMFVPAPAKEHTQPLLPKSLPRLPLVIHNYSKQHNLFGHQHAHKFKKCQQKITTRRIVIYPANLGTTKAWGSTSCSFQSWDQQDAPRNVSKCQVHLQAVRMFDDQTVVDTTEIRGLRACYNQPDAPSVKILY